MLILLVPQWQTSVRHNIQKYVFPHQASLNASWNIVDRCLSKFIRTLQFLINGTFSLRGHFLTAFIISRSCFTTNLLRETSTSFGDKQCKIRTYFTRNYSILTGHKASKMNWNGLHRTFLRRDSIKIFKLLTSLKILAYIVK